MPADMDQMAATDIGALPRLLEAQQRAFVQAGPPDSVARANWLNRLAGVLAAHKDEIAHTISRDFGNRTRELTLLADVLGSINALKFARDHLGEWMQPEPHAGLFPDAEGRVEHVPLGVVGMLSPWNFPVNLVFAPLAGIIAAGNRCIIKPSELTPETSALIARMIRSRFEETEIAVVLGGPDLAAAFTRLPFDHMIYTGSTSVGRHVMRAAADNLVPITLELGGKSPVIISRSAPLDDAAARVMTIKTLNAGQICLAPDYVFVPREKLDGFVQAAETAVSAIFPTLRDNADYTTIINERHYARLQSYLDEAKAAGTRVVQINPAHESFAEMNKNLLLPTLVIAPSPDLAVMREEIFGPILAVLTYDDIGDAIDFVNSRPHPLALYYFGQDAAEERRVITRTRSGGVTVNDVMTHAFSETMPFGGVGESGMGAYHGKPGFVRFSHARAIYRQGKAVEAEYMLRAPFGQEMRDYIDRAIAQ